MTIDGDLLFQILGLLGTIVGVLWYVSNLIGNIKTDLAQASRENEVQDRVMDTLSAEGKNNYTQCREGRIVIWENLNALKMQVAKLEARLEHRDKE